MNNKLIIALDDMSEQEAKDVISKVSEECSEYMDRILFKVNDLLARKGLDGIKEMIEGTGAKMMLDPKWHDIGNTLKHYIEQLSDSGLSEDSEYVTIHASNGYEGCKDIVDKKKELGVSTKILAVTALTSLGEKGTQSVFGETPMHSVLKLAGQALEAGVDGIVCSPLEGEALREVYRDEYGDFIIVNPGVRFEGGDTHDQKRTQTPELTIKNGATDIVMGRPILEAKDMSASVKRFFEETKDVTYGGNQGNYEFEKLLYTGNWEDLLKYIGAFYFRPEGGKYCRLASGLLSNAYINIGTTERNYLVVEKAASELAAQIRDKEIQADIVMGAQMGSVRSSLVLAKKLGTEQSIYTEKSGDDNEEMKLKRHDVSLRGKKVIISEDIVTKGSTLRKMKSMIEEEGGEVVAIACVGNRHGSEDFDGIPLVSCYVPEQFEFYWDDTTPEDQRKDFPRVPDGAVISEKPKDEWGELVKSMGR